MPLADWAWWTPVIQGAAVEADQRGFHLHIHPLRDGSELETLLNEMEDTHVDGVIVVTGEDTPFLRDQSVRRPATVLIDDIIAEPVYPTVRSSNWQGGYEVGMHLLKRGRTNPVVVAPTTEAAYIDERIAGLRAAFKDAGIEVPSSSIIRTEARFNPVEAVPQEVTNAALSVRDFDAVFAVSDFLAAGVLRHLRKACVSVPDQVSVVGFDDERAALLLDPTLTTVRQPYVQMGAAAVEILTATTKNDETPVLLELPVKLIVRASS